MNRQKKGLPRSRNLPDFPPASAGSIEENVRSGPSVRWVVFFTSMVICLNAIIPLTVANASAITICGRRARMTHPKTRFLTPGEISELFQIPVRSVHHLARVGKIPAMKVGRLWRFREHDINRWIESQYETNPDFPEIHRKAMEIVEASWRTE